MPGRGWFGLRADHDEDSEEGLDFEASSFGCGVEPAEVADAVESGRQDVLEIAAHELIGGERALAGGGPPFWCRCRRSGLTTAIKPHLAVTPTLARWRS
jgi:hypothetical protein